MFPTNFTNAVDSVTQIMAAHINNLEHKVGIDNDPTVTSLDYMIRNHIGLQTGVHGLAITTGKTLTVQNSLTLSGNDGASLAIGAGGILGTGAYANISLYAPLASPTFTGLIGINVASVSEELSGWLYLGGAFTTAPTNNVRGIKVDASAALGVGFGYALFDASGSTSGTANADHIIGFQARPIHASTGTLSTLYGAGSFTINNGGVVTNAYGYYVANPAGTGTITNNYGIYIGSLTKGGTLNYAIYTAGTTPSYFGGDVQIYKEGTDTTLTLGTNTVSGLGSTLKLLGQSGGGTPLSSSWILAATGFTHFDSQTLTDIIAINTVAGKVGICDSAPGEVLDVTGNINCTGVIKIDDVQVISNRVVDARIDDAINSGDATTDGVIDAIVDCLIAHGLVAAA